ncbi:MAG TPA: transglutaminase family protein [Polyangiaceae bacterium]|nr:transglutaminase family protein [Polyangiaceae bacterium]
MRFKVAHQTLYRYDTPVRFAPHVLRLTPRPERVSILSHDLTVTPAPAERADFVDLFGNRLTRLVFEGEADALRIESRFELDTLASADPFCGGAPMPALPWPDIPGDGLEAYRRETQTDPSVRAFAEGLAARSAGAPLAFLSALTHDLFMNMERATRPEGAARSPGTTLATRKGACRDITVLFLAACRSLGMPARFVSGYQAKAHTPDGQRHMHAWAEVHLQGIGWAGFDATHGMAVADGHVALCAAPTQASTMPVEGAWWGSAHSSTLDVSVMIATS